MSTEVKGCEVDLVEGGVWVAKNIETGKVGFGHTMRAATRDAMTLWVRITKEHIQAGRAEGRCPAELAVLDATGRDHVRITSPEYVYVDGVPFTVVPNSRFMLQRFLEGIDQGKYVKSLTIGLEYDPQRLEVL